MIAAGSVIKMYEHEGDFKDSSLTAERRDRISQFAAGHI